MEYGCGSRGIKMTTTKVKDVKIGAWFYHNQKWFQILYTGTNNIKATQIGSVKVYTLPIDTEVEIK